MLEPRTLSTLSTLKDVSKRLPLADVPVKHVHFVHIDKEETRFTNTNKENSKAAFVNLDEEELGGVGGAEPLGLQQNPVNWKAGAITAVSVLLAGWWMLRSKSKRAR